jgi:uncharacterized membrane protein
VGADKPGRKSERSVAPHVRRLRVRALRNRLQESLLFLPAIMLLGSIGVGLALIELHQVDVSTRWPRPFHLSEEVATALLSTIAGAMITTAGVVFSILVVSLQLASGQFSPRVLRGFWRDRHVQVLIGLLMSTFAISVLALTSIDPETGEYPPYMVTATLLLTLASVASIVIYLDRVSRQQYVGRIMERVVDETHGLTAELPFGKRVGMRVGDEVPPPDLARLGPPFVVRAPVDGWVQQISRRAVVAAVPPDSVVRLDTRVGTYTTIDMPIATIWPIPPAVDQPRVARLLAEAVIVGTSRTMQQDIDFGLDQLNDIALRGMADEGTDLSTATEAIFRLGSVLRPLLLADLPPHSVRDGQGRVLLTPVDLDHAGYVRQALDQVRIHAAPYPQVQHALVRTLRMLLDAISTVEDRDRARAELERQLDLAVAGSGKVTRLLTEDLRRIEAAREEAARE